MKKLLLLLFLSILACKPDEKKDITNKAVYDEAGNLHKPPEFKGGFEAFYRHVHKSVMIPQAEEPGDYTLHMQFIIEKDGSFSNIKPYINSSPDSLGLVEKATKAIKNYPKCEPAEINGKAVKHEYILPLYISY